MKQSIESPVLRCGPENGYGTVIQYPDDGGYGGVQQPTGNDPYGQQPTGNDPYGQRPTGN